LREVGRRGQRQAYRSWEGQESARQPAGCQALEGPPDPSDGTQPLHSLCIIALWMVSLDSQFLYDSPMRKILLLLWFTGSLAAQKLPATDLLKMAGSSSPSPAFQQALLDTMGVENVQKGVAVIGEGPDFLWAVESAQTPTLVVDDGPAAT